jgi:protein-L-isoaspartate(D-aspartate) O-methyltransferase
MGTESVLEIGSGSGYMAGLLARMSHHVTTLEINPDLAEFAAQNLSRAVVANVDIRAEDGSCFSLIKGDFDVIVLSGSVASIPSALTDKLRLGGRLIAMVGEEPVLRTTLVTRTEPAGSDSHLQGLVTQHLWETMAPRLVGFPESQLFRF